MPVETRQSAGSLPEGSPHPARSRGFRFFGGAPANAGAAPGGGRPALQHQPDLVHVAGAGTGRRALGGCAEPDRRRADADRHRARASFLLGLGRPPEVRYKAAEGVTPRLQRLLDAFEVSPALIKTATWDVVAWNRAAAAVLTDYGALPPGQRNILRLIFGRPARPGRATGLGKPSRASWSARSGRMRRAPAPSPKSVNSSTSFAGSAPNSRRCGATMTFTPTARGSSASGIRCWARSTLEYSAFAVDGRPDLGMVVYNPVTAADADRIRSLAMSPSVSREPLPQRLSDLSQRRYTDALPVDHRADEAAMRLQGIIRDDSTQREA